MEKTIQLTSELHAGVTLRRAGLEAVVLGVTDPWGIDTESGEREIRYQLTVDGTSMGTHALPAEDFAKEFGLVVG